MPVVAATGWSQETDQGGCDGVQDPDLVPGTAVPPTAARAEEEEGGVRSAHGPATEGCE